MAEISRKSNENSEESVIKKRGMEQWQRKTPKEEQYKQIVSKMSEEEREKEREGRVGWKKDMPEWHKHEEKRHPFQSKEYRTGGIREQYIGTGESTYISPEEEEHINELMSEYKGKDREEIEARLKGFKSTAERKEIRTRIGRDITKKVRERYQEQNYNPEDRYTEAVEGLKYRVGIAKEGLKKLATPAGLVGGIIGAISPKMTVEEKIKEERKKAALEEKIAKRRELLEKREHEIFVAAAYGSGKIPIKNKAKLRPRTSSKFLSGFGNLGGFSLGGRPTQKIVSRQPERQVIKQHVASNPFGLDSRGIANSVQRQVVRPLEKRIVRIEIRPQRADEVLGLGQYWGTSRKVEPRPSMKPQKTVVVNTSDPLGLNIYSGNSPVLSKKKKSISNLGVEGYF